MKALAHPARLRILDILREGEACVCHLTAMLGARQSYVSQHLAVLRQAGFVQDRKDGLNVYYRLAGDRAQELLDLLNDLVSDHVKETGEDLLSPPLTRALPGCDCPKCKRWRRLFEAQADPAVGHGDSL